MWRQKPARKSDFSQLRLKQTQKRLSLKDMLRLFPLSVATRASAFAMDKSRFNALNYLWVSTLSPRVPKSYLIGLNSTTRFWVVKPGANQVWKVLRPVPIKSDEGLLWKATSQEVLYLVPMVDWWTIFYGIPPDHVVNKVVGSPAKITDISLKQTFAITDSRYYKYRHLSRSQHLTVILLTLVITDVNQHLSTFWQNYLRLLHGCMCW